MVRDSLTRHLPVLLTLTLAILCALPAGATEIDDLARDYMPVDAHVLLVQGQEVLLDVDSSQTVNVGDLFAVVEDGAKVTHPVTGAVIGTLTEIKGYLEVDRIASGYSYAKPLSGVVPGRGAKVRRYEGVAAVFADPEGKGEAAYAELRQKLPHLKWSYRHGVAAPAQAADGQQLIFAYSASRLEVRRSSGLLLRAYALAPGLMAAPAMPAPQVPAGQPPAKQSVFPREVGGDPALPAGLITKVRTQRSKNFWQSSPQPGNPAGMAQGVFLAGQGPLLAVATNSRVELFAYSLESDQLTSVGKVELPGGLIALRLDAADLDQNGVSELYLTAHFSGSISSLVVAESGGQLTVQQEGIPWFFRTLRSGDQRLLLAQERGGSLRIFGPSVFQVVRAGDQLQAGAVIPLPPKSNLYSFQPLPLPEGLYTAKLANDDRLELYRGVSQLGWRSEEKFGGAEEFLPADDSNEPEHVYLPAVLQATGTGTLLVPVSEGTEFPHLRSYSSSHLKGLAVEQGELVERWRTKQHNGYLVDQELADLDGDGVEELILLELYSHSNILSPGQFGFVSYKLPN